MDREQEGRTEDDVDLARVRMVDVEREQDDVDELIGKLDLRALVALQDVLGDQWMQPQRAADGLDAVGVEVDRIDPGRRSRRAAVRDGTQTLRLRELAVAQVRHADGAVCRLRCGRGRRGASVGRVSRRA